MQKMSVKKFQAAIVAVAMVFGMIATPALAMNATYTKSNGAYKVTSAAKTKKTLAFTGLNAKGKAKKSVSVVSSIKFGGANKGTYKVTTIKKNAFKAAKATKITLPNTVTKIEKQAFNGAKAKKLTVTIKSTKLTKKSVKGCFKGAKAKTITVKVPRSKLKAYKKVFTKANTGAKRIVVRAI